MTDTSARPGNTPSQPPPGYYQPPGPSAPLAPRTKPKPAALKVVGIVAGGLVLLFIGLGIGLAGGKSAVPGYQRQAAQARAKLTTEQGKLAAEQAKLTAEQGQVQTAQGAAQNATAKAQALARTQYASKVAALKQQQRTVAKQERTVKAEQGQIQASAISADGVYVVGSDVASGTWHTSGNGGSGNQCYYATLNSTNTSDISDNNNFDGPETVDLSGVHAFQISGGCTWVKVG